MGVIAGADEKLYQLRTLKEGHNILQLTLSPDWRADPVLRDALDWDLAPRDTGKLDTECLVRDSDLTSERNFHPYPLGNNLGQAYITTRIAGVLSLTGSDILVIKGHDLKRRDLWLYVPNNKDRKVTQQPHIDKAPYRSEHYPVQALHCMYDDVPGGAETAYLRISDGMNAYQELVSKLIALKDVLKFSGKDLEERLSHARMQPTPNHTNIELVYDGIVPILEKAIALGLSVPGIGKAKSVNQFWHWIYTFLGDCVFYTSWEPNMTAVCRQDLDGYMHARFVRQGPDGSADPGQLLVHIG